MSSEERYTIACVQYYTPGVFNSIQLGTDPMRRNTELFSQEKADHARQVRAEIGRGLREEYDAGAWPMPDRLADLLEKLSSQRPWEEDVR
jgi:hypothetical protein